MNSQNPNKLNVAVIGYGHLGKWHCEKVSSSSFADLEAIVDSSSQSREKAKEVYPDTKIFVDLDELDAINIDAAIVVVPTSHHFEVVDHFLTRGIHVFCEKPLIQKLDQAKKLNEMVKGEDVILQVGHSERFHQVWDEREKFKKFFDDQAVIKFNRMAISKGRAKDVDVVHDLMIHDLDLLNFLIEEKPCKLRAWGCKMVNDKWDSVTAEIKFPSGKVAILSSTRHYVEEKRYLSATNKNGCLLVDLLNHKLKTSEILGKDEDFIIKEESYNKRDHLKIEQEFFYSSILNNSPVVVNIDDGIYAVALVDKILKSLELQKELEI
jgi:predicted dehydrogenase